MKVLTVEIFLDFFAGETSWSLTNLCTGEVQASVPTGYYEEEYCSKQTLSYCAHPEVEYEFTIYDSYGDGQDSNYPQLELPCLGGNYTVTYDGEVVAFDEGDWGFEVTDTFGPPCEGPPPPKISVYSRVSSGKEWIDRAIECKSKSSGPISKSGKTSKSFKTSKSGKSRKIDIGV